jgi:hypothetical protein
MSEPPMYLFRSILTPLNHRIARVVALDCVLFGIVGAVVSATGFFGIGNKVLHPATVTMPTTRTFVIATAFAADVFHLNQLPFAFNWLVINGVFLAVKHDRDFAV